jgi:dGTPase
MSAAVRTRRDVEADERERLAPHAVRSAESHGRVVPEAEHALRTAFQRDRDRIVHSQAFRRLQYKTQVFLHHEGDHYRNRLTHTLEGSQIARTLARALRLNEDLAEAVALAHDLGHTPFGHAGERALDRLMASAGGFDHNRQSLRVVDLLEERYPRFRGLNLCAETREGLCKHGVAFAHPVPLPARGEQPSLEAQIADHADEIAYTNHDVDDGLRSEILDLRQLDEIELWRVTRREIEARIGADAPERVLRAQTIARLIDRLVGDLVAATAERVEGAGVRSPEDVRACKEPLVGLSPSLRQQALLLKRFLYENLYHHPRVVRATVEAEQVLQDLFLLYRAEPQRLPAHVVERFGGESPERALADYVAGMTDRFALAEHERFFGGDVRP